MTSSANSTWAEFLVIVLPFVVVVVAFQALLWFQVLPFASSRATPSGLRIYGGGRYRGTGNTWPFTRVTVTADALKVRVRVPGTKSFAIERNSIESATITERFGNQRIEWLLGPDDSFRFVPSNWASAEKAFSDMGWLTQHDLPTVTAVEESATHLSEDHDDPVSAGSDLGSYRMRFLTTQVVLASLISIGFVAMNVPGVVRNPSIGGIVFLAAVLAFLAFMVHQWRTQVFAVEAHDDLRLRSIGSVVVLARPDIDSITFGPPGAVLRSRDGRAFKIVAQFPWDRRAFTEFAQRLELAGVPVRR